MKNNSVRDTGVVEGSAKSPYSTKPSLARLRSELLARAERVAKSKSVDYGSDDDPFLNFRAAESMGVDPRLAVMARMLDKMARVRRFVEAGALADEPLEDCFVDLVNFVVILAALCAEERSGVLGPESSGGVPSSEESQRKAQTGGWLATSQADLDFQDAHRPK